MVIKRGMNSGLSGRICMLASSAVFRRQEFLIRCLGGYSDPHPHQKRMQQVKSMGGQSLEADAENILRAITPTLDPSRHKGQAGMYLYTFSCIWCVIPEHFLHFVVAAGV